LEDVALKVVFNDAFYAVYSADPAAAAGRMESIVSAIADGTTFVTAEPAAEADINAVHTHEHIARVRRSGLYAVAALAAGGTVQAAEIALTEPAFALVRPPGHHASSDSSWGFCYFNNMAVALDAMIRSGRIRTAAVLDIDLHFGDGTVNILGQRPELTICNIRSYERKAYLEEVARRMAFCTADLIAISAGFDAHLSDWGGILHTDDYTEIGRRVRAAARNCGGGCFGVLEGGYNHNVLGRNVRALLEGLG
jgi:acetoin utilization deacetylase AcuC-like enzyme